MKTTTSTIRIEIESETEDSFPVSVYFEHLPACRGFRDRYGQQLEPDDPESLEFLCAESSAGVPVKLDPREIDAAREQAWDFLNDRD